MAVRAGELIAGRYRLKSLLGSGGMGDVYAAETTTATGGGDVAIKILRPDHAREARAVARFLREARAGMKIRHPNVVRVLETGLDDNGLPFIVQELLVGEDLAAHMHRQGGRLGVEQTLELMRPVIEAIAAAHAGGVLHRDLKPENVFITRNDRGDLVPKLLDFGISKILDEIEAEDRTQTGVIVGTPHYMAPEQIIGSRELDGRVDVWALGVMLFELMTGELPFGSRDDGRIFMRIALAEPTPLDHLVPNAPKDLSRIVQRCLRRNIGERYPSAAELARDLNLLRESRPIESTQRLAVVRLDDMPPSIVPALTPERAQVPTLDEVAPMAAAVPRSETGRSETPPPIEMGAMTASRAGRAVPKTNAAPQRPRAFTGSGRVSRPSVIAVVIAIVLASVVVAAFATRSAPAERTVPAASP